MQAQIMAAQAAYAQALSAEAAAQLAQMNQNNAAGSSDIQPSASGFLCPVSGAFITDAYGWRIHPKKKVESFHTGVDFAVGHGTPICAMAAGTVSDCGSNNSYGNYVTLTHGGGYGSFYGHMSQYVVSAGETVSQGQVIGYVGSTGISTGFTSETAGLVWGFFGSSGTSSTVTGTDRLSCTACCSSDAPVRKK